MSFPWILSAGTNVVRPKPLTARWNRGDHVAADRLLPPRVRHVYDGRLTAHSDGFGNGSNTHLDAYACDEIARQLDPLAPDGVEAGQGEGTV